MNKTVIMVADRKQIKALLYLVLPAVMLWVALSSFFAYELGKNGLHNINWGWILQNCLPVIIIAFFMLFQGIKLQGEYKKGNRQNALKSEH